jgi:hypothetical protein
VNAANSAFGIDRKNRSGNRAVFLLQTVDVSGLFYHAKKTMMDWMLLIAPWILFS